MTYKDFIVNFCLDRGFQPKQLLYINFTNDLIAYGYVEIENVPKGATALKKIMIEEPVKWDF
jgi:hypothetical protein